MCVLKVGGRVRYRGAFGLAAPEVATVIGLEVCPVTEKEGGIEVSSVDTDRLREGYHVMIDLDNGHWCRQSQIEEVL